MILKEEVVIQYGNAKILIETDYPLCEAFIRETNPNEIPMDGCMNTLLKTAKEYLQGSYLTKNQYPVVMHQIYPIWKI